MTIGENNVAHGGMNRCKRQIKQRLGGAAELKWLLIPRRKRVGENEGGRAVKTPLRHGRD